MRDDGAGAPEPILVDVRVFDLDDEGPDPVDSSMSDEERRRAASMATPQLRRRAAARFALRRRAIGEALGVAPAEVPLGWDDDGAPRVALDRGELHLSASSSGAICVLAWSASARVGVDVEDLAALVDPVAVLSRAAGPVTARAVASSASPRATALRCWTRLEALVKATGTGLGASLGTLEVPTSPWCEDVAFAPSGGLPRCRCTDLAVPSAAHFASLVVAGADERRPVVVRR